jgi:hypothetical protein
VAGVERQFIGPLWVQAWVAQSVAVEMPSVGVGLRLEF